MTPERWREIERLYHLALERDAGERAACLADACRGDDALRREVESLLEYQRQAGDFIEQPAVEGHLASAVRRLEQPSAPGRFVGRVFGSYELTALIAAGGMGEVYRAVDTRLNRTVAIKTLPAHLSSDPERRERFTREARIVSSLNHPHICMLHDVGVQDDIQYLVMEDIDGETLQKRLEQGPLPLAQALEYAIQIVDALDKAHRRGIVHRDLTPRNVMLAKPGVKLLDFGLAMWHTPAAGLAFNDPTRAGSPALTAEGTIQGTLQYISPEQLEGKPSDARTDIFAFGAVAYEMITGRSAFPAANQAQLVARILKDDPPLIADLVPEAPRLLSKTIARCLAKDPDERWQTATDLLYQLRTIASLPQALDPREPQARRRFPRRIARGVWMAVLAASLVGTFVWSRTRDIRPPDPVQGRTAVRYTLSPAPGTVFHSGFDLSFVLSPDGQYIVYVGVTASGLKQLWLRSLYEGVTQSMPGTEGANSPFWSPDSQWIGFFADNNLKKVRVSSGLVRPIASNTSTRGGATWGVADVIVFRPSAGGLSRVSARGGAVSRLTRAVGFWPQFLGDGEHFIYAAALSNSINISSLRDEAPRSLMTFPVRVSSIAYVPGYIFFVQDATLFARPFDETRLEFSGAQKPIVDGIPSLGPGLAPFSISAAGLLAYRQYPPGTAAVLQWFKRDGSASLAIAPVEQYVGFALSPDDRRLAFSRTGKAGGADVWVRDLSNGQENQLTFDGAAFTPQMSPDGARIVFTGSGETPRPTLFIKNVAGGGAAFQVGVSTVANLASSWSGDGSIVSVRLDRANRLDLWSHRLHDGVDERLPFNTPSSESHGKVSPDSRWIAYDTDASGKTEVWVASFPSGAMPRQVSVGGGRSPEWGEGSKEIFYISDDNRLMATPFSAGPTTGGVGAPRTLFHIANFAAIDPLGFETTNDYVAASNGQRFLVAVRAPDPKAPPITIVVNWDFLLKR
jgi:serine/threonine protein kinase/Tol biopolymer transport system component